MDKNRAGLALLITPMEGVWSATAIETPAKTLRGVFDDHSHKVLGEFATIEKAIEVCETFARNWLKKRGAYDPCACGEIQPPPPPPPPKTRRREKSQA